MANTVEINFEVNTENVLKNINKLVETFQQLNIVLPNLTQQTEDLNEQLGNQASTVRQSSSIISNSFTAIATGINQTIEIAQKMFDVFMKGYSSTIGESIKFEKELAKIATLLEGDTRPQIEQFSKDILELQKNFGSDRATIAEAYYQGLSSGAINASNATQFLTTANKLAVGGVTDINTAVNGLTSAYSVYKDEVKDVKKYSDVFFIASAKGKTDIKELSEQMGQVAPIAKTFNVSFDELYASVAGITTVIPNTSQAVTSLKATITAMSSPTETMKVAMKSLGIESLSTEVKTNGLNNTLIKLLATTNGSSEQINAMFGGSEAALGANALAQSINTTKDAMDTMKEASKNAGDTTETAFKKLQETTSVKLDTLIGRIKATATEISNSFLPAVNKFIDIILNAGEFVDKYSAELTALGVVIGGLTALYVAQNAATLIYNATMIASSVAVNGLAVAQKALNLIMSANPIGLLVVALTSFIAYIAKVITETIGFKSAFEYMKAGILNIIATFVDFGSTIVKYMTTPLTYLLEGVAKVAGLFSDSLAKKIRTAVSSLQEFSTSNNDTADSLRKSAKETEENALQLANKYQQEQENAKSAKQLAQEEAKKSTEISNSTKSTISYNDKITKQIELDKKNVELKKQQQEEAKKHAQELKKEVEYQEQLNNKLKELQAIDIKSAIKLIDQNAELQKIQEIQGSAKALELALKVEQLNRLGKVKEAEIEIKKAVIDANIEREKGLIKAQEEEQKRINSLKKEINKLSAEKVTLAFNEIDTNPILKQIKEISDEQTSLNLALSTANMSNIEKELTYKKELAQLEYNNAKQVREKNRQEITNNAKLAVQDIENRKKMELENAKIVSDKQKQLFLDVISFTNEAYKNSINSLKSLVSGDFLDAFSSGVSSATDILKAGFSGVQLGLSNLIQDRDIAKISDKLKKVIEYLSPVFNALADSFKTSLSSLSTIITTTLQTGFKLVSGGFYQDLLSGLSSYAKSVNNTISALSNTFKDIKEVFEGTDLTEQNTKIAEESAKKLSDLSISTQGKLLEIDKRKKEDNLAYDEKKAKLEQDNIDKKSEIELEATDKINQLNLIYSEQVAEIKANDILTQEEKEKKLADLKAKNIKDIASVETQKIKDIADAQKTLQKDLLDLSTEKQKNEKILAEDLSKISIEKAKEEATIKEESAKKLAETQATALSPLEKQSQLLADKIKESANYLKDNASTMATQISNSAKTIASSLALSAPDLIKAFVTALPTLIKSITDNVPTIIKAIIASLPELTNALSKELPKILDMLIKELPKLADALFKSIFALLPTLLPKLVELIKELVKTFITFIPDIIKEFMGFVTEIIKALPDIVNAFIEEIPNIIKAFIEGLPALINAIILAIPQIAIALIKSIPEIVTALIVSLTKPETVKSLFSGMWEAIKSVFNELPSLFKDVGAGIWNAIKAGFKALDISEYFSGLGELGGKVWAKIVEGFKNVTSIWGKGKVEEWLGLDIPFVKFSQGGAVKGQAKVAGNSEANDTVPALLSPGEFVIDRKTLAKGDLAVWNKLAENGVVQKYGFGGTILGRGLKWIGNTTVNTAKSVGEGALQLVKVAGKGVTGIANVVVDTGKGAFNIAKGVVEGTGQAIVSADIRQLADVVGAGLLQTGELFVDTASNTANVIGEVIKGTGTVVYDTAGKVLTAAIPPPFDEYYQGIIKYLNVADLIQKFDIKEFIKSPLDFTKEFLKKNVSKPITQSIVDVIMKPMSFFANGGFVGSNYKKGTDTVPAMLTPGELVIPRSHTNSIQDVVSFASQFFRQPQARQEYGNNNQAIRVDFSELISYLNNSDREIVIQVDGLNIAKAVRNQVKRGFAL